MAHSPQITILMPAYNAGQHISEAIDSILQQTFGDFELLIIDDGSVDDTSSRVKAFDDSRVRYISGSENVGVAGALNRGLHLARGEFIARHDADDLSMPGRLEEQLEYLRCHPSIALVGTQAITIDARGRKLGEMLRPLTPPSIQWFQCFDNPFIHSSVMYRTGIFRDELNGYRSFKTCEDYELWSRAGRKYEMANLGESLVHYRIHDASIMGTMNLHATELMQNNRNIIESNLAHSFPDSTKREDAEHFSAYRLGFSDVSIETFASTFERLLMLYARRHQNILGDPDFSRTLALQFSHIGYNLLTLRRSAALRFFAKAIRAWPGIALHFPISRMAALFLIGNHARGLYRKVKEPTR